MNVPAARREGLKLVSYMTLASSAFLFEAPTTALPTRLDRLARVKSLPRTAVTAAPSPRRGRAPNKRYSATAPQAADCS